MKWVVVAVGLLVTWSPLRAQEPHRGDITLGLGVGLFADYPADFGGASCEQGAGGMTALIRRAVSTVVSVEAGATVTSGVGLATCALDLRPAPLDGEVYTRTSLDEAITGESFFATNLSAFVDPFATDPVGPRLRLGVGRLWGKKLWTWVYGAGLRLQLGSNAIVLDVERWNLGYDMRRELLIYRENSADELQSVEILRRSPKPWLFRLSWERRIG